MQEPRGKYDKTAHECWHYCPRGAHMYQHYIQKPGDPIDEYRLDCPEHVETELLVLDSLT